MKRFWIFGLLMFLLFIVNPAVWANGSDVAPADTQKVIFESISTVKRLSGQILQGLGNIQGGRDTTNKYSTLRRISDSLFVQLGKLDSLSAGNDSLRAMLAQFIGEIRLFRTTIVDSVLTKAERGEGAEESQPKREANAMLAAQLSRLGMGSMTTQQLTKQLSDSAIGLTTYIADYMVRSGLIDHTFYQSLELEGLIVEEKENLSAGSIMQEVNRLAAENAGQRRKLALLRRQEREERKRLTLENQRRETERSVSRLQGNARTHVWLMGGIAAGSVSDREQRQLEGVDTSSVSPTLFGGLGFRVLIPEVKTGFGLDFWGLVHPGPGPQETGLNWAGGAALNFPLIYEPGNGDLSSSLQLGGEATIAEEKVTGWPVIGLRIQANVWGLNFQIKPGADRVIGLGLEYYVW